VKETAGDVERGLWGGPYKQSPIESEWKLGRNDGGGGESPGVGGKGKMVLRVHSGGTNLHAHAQAAEKKSGKRLSQGEEESRGMVWQDPITSRCLWKREVSRSRRSLHGIAVGENHGLTQTLTVGVGGITSKKKKRWGVGELVGVSKT